MKKVQIFFIIGILAILSYTAFPQNTRVTRPVIYGTSRPTTCNYADIFINTTTKIISFCMDPTNSTAANRWSDYNTAGVTTQGGNGTYLVQGGQVIWTSAYTFNVSAASYYIAGTYYTSTEQSISLTAADMTNDRIDVIAVDTSGTVVKITGTAASQPSEPDTPPASQLKLTIVYVTANTSSPVSTSNTTIYLENAGSGGSEYDCTTSGSGFNDNSTNNPRTGSKDIEGTTVADAAYTQCAKGSGSISPSTINYLIFYIRSKATWVGKRSLLISLRSSGVLKGKSLTLGDGAYGFSSSNTSAYQQVAIPIDQFATLTTDTINQIRITDSGGSIGFYIDDVVFQTNGTVTTTTTVAPDPTIQNYRLTLSSGNPIYLPINSTPASTDTTAETTTFTVAPGWTNGTICTPTSTANGLTTGTRYFLHAASSTAFSYHTSVANALAGTSKVDLTGNITSVIQCSGVSNTTIYASPYKSTSIALYTGSAWVVMTPGELSLALGTLTSALPYDVFMDYNSGVPQLVMTAWTSDTVRATTLTTQNNINVQTGHTGYRYLGTFRTNTTTTTIDDAGGISAQNGAKRFVFNGDNQIDSPVKVGESSSWVYAVVAWRQAHGAAGNMVECFNGLLNSSNVNLRLTTVAGNGASPGSAEISIGEDSTSVPSPLSLGGYTTNIANANGIGITFLNKVIPLGYHYYSWLEFVNNAQNTTFYGNDTNVNYGLTGTCKN